MSKRLSFTRLDTFERCPKQYSLRYIERAAANRPDSLTFGSTLHTALEDSVDALVKANHTGEIDESLVLDEYEKAWRASDCTDRTLYEEGKRLLSQWAARMGVFTHGQVLDTERKFTMQLAGVTVTGIIDRIDLIDEHTIRVIDYKSSKAWMVPDDSMQLALYGMAAKQMYKGIERVQVGFDLLRHNQLVVCDMTDEIAEKCLQWVQTLAAQLQSAQQYPARLNTFCAWCDYCHSCSAYTDAIQQPTHVLQLADDEQALADTIMATKQRLKELQGMQRTQALHGEGQKRPSVRRSRKLPADKAAKVLARYGVDLPLSALSIDSKSAAKMTKHLSKSDRALAGAAIEAETITSNTTVVR